MGSDEKPKGEVFHVLDRPANPDVLNKAAWYNEYLGTLPKKVERTDVVHFPNLVFELLKLALWKYGEVFFLIEKDGNDKTGRILPPGSVTPVMDATGVVGYYEGTLPEDGDLSKVKVYQPEEILHLKGTA